VNDILESLGAANKPVIMALNKMDMVKGGLRLAISNPNGRILKYLPLQAGNRCHARRHQGNAARG